MKKIFVSGCYDILHAGHVQFFEDAHALGDHLTVCFASDEVLMLTKQRKPSLPEDNKKILIGSLRCVNEVVSSSDLDPIFDFKTHIERIKPAVLAVTDDDWHVEKKCEFCAARGIELVILPKRNAFTQVSTTGILGSIKEVDHVPLRVDFAGGWLDVPTLARAGAYIVNCAIQPLVSLESWPYKQNAGLGGSAAYALLKAKNGVQSELRMGVGWQDPAIIKETGLCVWQSGNEPILDIKVNPSWLAGKMMIVWTGRERASFDQVAHERDYDAIAAAGMIARNAVRESSLSSLGDAIRASYAIQLGEGMLPLPNISESLASKYLGAGHGGYALYLFPEAQTRATAYEKAVANSIEAVLIEPYIKNS